MGRLLDRPMVVMCYSYSAFWTYCILCAEWEFRVVDAARTAHGAKSTRVAL